jgi:hypothetical protein
MRMFDTRPRSISRNTRAASGHHWRVAVIDSGWAGQDSRVLPVIDALGNNGVPGDQLGHGTSCIARLLAVAERIEVQPIRIFSNRLQATAAQLQRALNIARDTECDAITLSLGLSPSDRTTVLDNTFSTLAAMGLTVFAASRWGDETFPALRADVIGVGAMYGMPFGCIRSTTDRSIEYLAAGLIRMPNGTLRGGPSYAVPIVAGYAARQCAHLPRPGVEVVRQALQLATAEDPPPSSLIRL